MNLGSALQRPIVTMDAIRGRMLRIASPIAPRLFRDRERRVAVYGALAIAIAFVTTFAAPMFLLAVGPVVLGAPHLVADIRYLVARPGLHRRAGFWVCVAGPACLSFVHPHAWISMAAIVGAALVARASFVRRALVAIAGIALVVACVRLGSIADIALAHGHNAIALALFCAWSRHTSRLHWLVVAGFAAGIVAIALGAFDGGPFTRLAQSGLYEADVLVATLAPLSDPVLSVRGVLAFAFAQSVHYALWVRLVPEVDRPRPGLRSFASSLRALAGDLGAPLIVLAGLGTIGLAAWACVSLTAARDGYLRLAIFHGPLELGAATLLLLERGRIGTEVLFPSAGFRAPCRAAEPGKT